MSRVLVAAVLLSFALNLYLFERGRRAAATPGAPPAPGTAAAQPVHATSRPAAGAVVPVPHPSPTGAAAADAEEQALAARCAGLEQELARLRARLALFEEQDPIGSIVNSTRPLREKLRALGALPDFARRRTAGALATILNRDPAQVRELFAVLADETDPAALRAIADVYSGCGGGAMHEDLPDELHRVALDALAHGEPAERRIAAAAVLHPFHWKRLPAGWDEVLAQAIRRETDKEALGAFVQQFSFVLDHTVPPPVVAAVNDTLDRLPPGVTRACALTTVGLATFAQDGGQGLYDRWSAAGTPDLREDIAAALVQCWNASNTALAPRSRPQTEEARTAQRQHFRDIYGGTANARTRADLVRTAHTRLGPFAGLGPEAAPFLRTIAAAEPDAALRQRLGRMADVVAGGAAADSPEAYRALSGRE